MVGIASGSASAFFAPGLVANALYGCAFLGSAAIGRPLAGVFAGEMYAFPQRVRTSALFRRIFSVVSLAWGGYMVLRAAVRLAVLLLELRRPLRGGQRPDRHPIHPGPDDLVVLGSAARPSSGSRSCGSPRSRPARHERRPGLVFMRTAR